MRRLGPGTHGVVALAIAVVLVGGGLARNVAAIGPDRSDVVLVLDFSGSILEDKANRNRFGAALERIAARVDAISADLVAGDATVTIVQFATRAADYPNCADLKLLGNPEAVGRFADCLRSVAAAYRKGVRTTLTNKIGIDTNYVAAMQRAAAHLPPGAVRPAMILFTDGKHDVKGVPLSQVQVTRDQLFGARTPFALLPVGMGLDPARRDALASGLASLQITRAMPACVSGAAFVWPQVVFETADQAGNAVAVALQDATCTFTVAPTPTPPPAPTPAAIKALRLAPGDGRIDIAWAPSPAKPAPVIDYTVRCRAGDGEWIASKEGVSLEPKTTIDGLTNGLAYRCEVAAVSKSGTGPWTAASTSVTPVGRPAAPVKPSVDALDGAVGISIVPVEGAAVTGYHYECSSDEGATWPGAIDVGPASTTAHVVGLTNGVGYVCRVFATNAIGVSDASPLSDAVRPCGSILECNTLLLPILAGVGLVMLIGILAAVFVGYRGRGGYVIAVVDTVHTANVGRGSRLGIAFVRDPETRKMTGIVADKGRGADVRIRHLSGRRFEVRDRSGKRVVADGDPVVVSDGLGARHRLVLQAFDTIAASPVASRR
ncbi:MAG TPA: fibronectin type III domain-containing protein [Candidatus Limnocylindrales bacterium]|nr:fibronectin type III domain-containing protein [Candidatus Limnocylindrales bacterium]